MKKFISRTERIKKREINRPKRLLQKFEVEKQERMKSKKSATELLNEFKNPSPEIKLKIKNYFSRKFKK